MRPVKILKPGVDVTLTDYGRLKAVGVKWKNRVLGKKWRKSLVSSTLRGRS